MNEIDPAPPASKAAQTVLSAAKTDLATGKAVDQLPAGYRQGIVTAIAIFITFSLVFLRFWTFEAPGKWNLPSIGAAALMCLAIMLQVYTLWRSLQIKDALISEYERTLRWFASSVLTMLVGLLLSTVAFTGILDP